jgi:2-C-methyl-D-erythritol 2,4-cyclodiphosphate synthase
MSGRVGLGFDVHPFGGDGPLVVGGVTLEGPGLAGHSDADVIAHAVADALLGAAGLPDLGSMFPASDERYRGVSSIGLLRKVADAVASEGWRVANVDVVVAAEAPALAPHLPAMVTALQGALVAVRPEQVTVKPKRAEGLGAIGRAEGIAAWAVVLLVTVDES